MTNEELKQSLEKLALAVDNGVRPDNPERPVLLAEEITNHVKKTYDLLLGRSCTISLVSPNSFYLDDFRFFLQDKEIFDKYKLNFFPDDPNIDGYALRDPQKFKFSYRKETKGQAFLKKVNFTSLLCNFSHELGHMIPPYLDDLVSEEARAYAFEYAWCEVIKRHDIGKVGGKIMDYALRYPDKDKFPLHYKAIEFVKSYLENGTDPLNLFWRLTFKLNSFL